MRRIGMLTCLLTATFAIAQDPKPESRILTYKEYAKLKHDVPYVLEFEVGKGALLIYGGRHVFDPADPQIADIQKEWERFKADVAYNEGGNPPTLGSMKNAIERYGEPGLLRYLAGQESVPVATFEPRDSDEIAALRKKYSDEQVAVFNALRGYLTFRNSKREGSPDDYMNGVLGGSFAKDHNLKGTPGNVRELEAACGRLFNGLKDWRTIPDNWFDPTKDGQFTNDMQNDSGHFRDKHIFAILTARASRGDRVFAVIGASHVPALEPALVAELGKPKRKRDGKLITER